MKNVSAQCVLVLAALLGAFNTVNAADDRSGSAVRDAAITTNVQQKDPFDFLYLYSPY